MWFAQHSTRKDSTRFLGELNPSLKNTHSLIWDPFKNSGVSFRVLKFSLDFPPPAPSPLQAALHPPASEDPSLFSTAGDPWLSLIFHLSCIFNQIISPWPGRRAQISSILKVKLKGNKNTKKTSSALLSSQVHPISQLLSPTRGSQMMLCGLAAAELSVPVSQVQPLQIRLTGSDVGPRNFIFQVPSKWWGCSAKFLNHWFILTVFLSSPPTPNTHQADLITTGLLSHC